MTTRIMLSRRGALITAGAYLVGCFAGGTAEASAPWPAVRLDFTNEIPSGVKFRRLSPASFENRHGRLEIAAVNEPRYLAGGLLIEGNATNLVRHPWTFGTPGGRARFGNIATSWLSTETAPDGSAGVLHIERLGGQHRSGRVRSASSTENGGIGVYSVWLRSRSGSIRLHLGGVDPSAAGEADPALEIGTEWQRFAARAWNVCAGNESLSAADHPLRFFGRIAAADWLGSLYAWGAQYEEGDEASSLIPPGAGATRRADDEVSMPTHLLLTDTRQGCLTMFLPLGGRAGSVILDSSRSERNGIRIEYSQFGRISARVGRSIAVTKSDVTQDKIVELTWNRFGIQIATGSSPDHLALRSAVFANPLPVNCGDFLRFGMTMDGRQPLNRPIASASFGAQTTKINAPLAPIIISPKYELVFGDEFSDPDVTRINQGAIGGSPGSPAWRSRYHWDRRTVINGEKQIYIDPDFAGTAARALEVEPFSIADGALRIRADRADPVRVSPFIWNYKYTSGCITSELTHWQKYGYFEISARLPLGKGLWPTFWLYPKRQGWPPEIDIVECSGSRRSSVHQGAIQAIHALSLDAPPLWIDGMVDISASFHSYGLEWTEKRLLFFIDGKKTLEIPNVSINEDMYLIANLAVGSENSDWIPNPDASTPFPSFFEIDYIRAFSRQ